MEELELKVKKFDNGEVWSLSRDNKEILLSEEEKKDLGCLAGESISMDNMGIYGIIDAKMRLLWNKHFPKEIPTLKFGDKVKSGDGTLGVVILKGRAPYTREVSYDIAFDNGLTVTYKESELNQLTIIK